jgi:MFS family permease
MVTRVVPLERRGRMMGYYNAAFFLAWGLGGTILTGPVADAIVASNSVIIMIYTIMILGIIGLLIYLLSQKILPVKKKKYLNLSWLIGFIILFSTGIAFFSIFICE